MPAVVTYWQLPDDDKDFLDFVQTTGTVLALPDRWVKRKEELALQPMVSYFQLHDRGQFSLEKHVLQISIDEHETSDGLRFGVPVMEPCVIAYERGRFLNGKLTLSNLSAYWDYPSEDQSTLVKKDQEFVRWAKNVMAWVRKASPEQVECNGQLYRATRRVKEAVSERKLEVALY